MPVKGPYHTRQQDELLDFLKTNSGAHHTVAQIKDHLDCCGKRIGKATIYRQLERLVDDGTVRKYIVESGDSACYEYVSPGEECQTHFHCKCETCGRLIHMDCDELEEIRVHLLSHHGFRWQAGKTVFYGTCAECMAAEHQASEERS